jgi:hypothetical protein
MPEHRQNAGSCDHALFRPGEAKRAALLASVAAIGHAHQLLLEADDSDFQSALWGSKLRDAQK